MARSKNASATATNGSNGTALATTAPKGTITRSAANQLLKARSVELYQDARRKQDEHRVEFESKFGRIDRIDDALLRDLQALQMRFAAIQARQRASSQSYGEPKVSKFVSTLGSLIGEVSAHLATDRALSLFEPVREQDYVGYAGRIGARGLDESVLEGYEIVDDQPAPTKDDEGEVCLHQRVEESEDDPHLRYCGECGEEFAAAEDEGGGE